MTVDIQTLTVMELSMKALGKIELSTMTFSVLTLSMSV
jgi:hypothetical protein